jgi:hypothetical protein
MSSKLEQIYVGFETEHGFLLPGFLIKSAYSLKLSECDETQLIRAKKAGKKLFRYGDAW